MKFQYALKYIPTAVVRYYFYILVMQCIVNLSEMASRRVQIVATKSERRYLILWMKKTVHESGTTKQIASRAVDAFPTILPNRENCSQVRKCHRQKALSWWNGRE